MLPDAVTVCVLVSDAGVCVGVMFAGVRIMLWFAAQNMLVMSLAVFGSSSYFTLGKPFFCSC